jgi:quercetin dioxygenase-like cupin family protein
MKVLAATLISVSLFALALPQAQKDAAQADASPAALAQAESIKIARSSSLQPSKGSAEHFTGSVQVEELFPAHDPSRVNGGKVTFEPGARSAWHTLPLGQTLIVTDGTGWIQQWGGPIEEMRKGDVIRIPPGVKHLARRYAKYSRDAHRHPGTAQWQSRRVDGKGHRRAIPQMIVVLALNCRRSR